MRKELGIGGNQGLRYSWGYPAIPDHRHHEIVFDLLPAREKLGMELTEGWALVPELATAAIVLHHPEAKYFSAVDPDENRSASGVRRPVEANA
jgi:5-methyltetrahydrofolate--homocysteine methyltransferase